VGLLVLLAVVGGSAEHGAGAAQLRRGPASIVLSVLVTLAGLAGVVSLALLFWGLVTRNRRTLGRLDATSALPDLVAGAALAIFACLSGLLALAARQRHLQSLTALGGKPVFRVGPETNSVPFNAVASFATSGVVVGVIVLLVVVKLVRSVGWRRVLRRLGSPAADTGTGFDKTDAQRPELETLSIQLACLTVADPDTEPDPRRAIIGCYLQMLEVAAIHGPSAGVPRRLPSTCAECLRRPQPPRHRRPRSRDCSSGLATANSLSTSRCGRTLSPPSALFEMISW